MALVGRWDIRTESYANGASITSLTDRAGSTNLNSNGGLSNPTYDSSLNAVKFISGSSQTIGSSSLGAALAASPAGSAWSIFFLIYQTSLGGDVLGGFGNSGQVNSAFIARTFASGTNPDFFFRDNADSTQQNISASGSLTASTWQVFHATYDGTSIRVGIDGVNISPTTTRTENLAGVTWNQFGLGAYWRSTVGSFWTGYLRECRVYNSDEYANLASIVSSMKSGPSTGISITSVNAGSDVYSGQTLVKVVGTGLSNVTSATYKGAACTAISKSSSLSITMTFPNFFTNNIKVGAQHALKVRG